ncbi:hypothetical protein ACH4SK_17440 [Streptomyces inhibens]|uniref:hypothetical protein n=1 Tax=Streptomyces inhibens TaxID=2293571 RepID=UPI0037A450C5
MQRKGFGYLPPCQAVNDDRWWSKGSDRPSKKEIAVPVANVRCKQRTALVKVWFEAEAGPQRAAIREHSGYFKRLAESKQRQAAALVQFLTADHCLVRPALPPQLDAWR